MRSLTASGLLLVALNLFALPVPDGMSRVDEQLAVGGVPSLRPISYRCRSGGNCQSCVPFDFCNEPFRLILDGEILHATCDGSCSGGRDGCVQTNQKNICRSECTSGFPHRCENEASGVNGSCGLVAERLAEYDAEDDTCVIRGCEPGNDWCTKCQDTRQGS